MRAWSHCQCGEVVQQVYSLAGIWFSTLCTLCVFVCQHVRAYPSPQHYLQQGLLSWPLPSHHALQCVCVCVCMCLNKCTYTHACSAFTNGQSLWGPLFSAILLLRHIVPGHRNRSSPLPLNRPKTKPCQASQQPLSVCHLSPDQWWCRWNKGPGQGRRPALFTVLMSGWHSQQGPSTHIHVYAHLVNLSVHKSLCHFTATNQQVYGQTLCMIRWKSCR